MSQKGTDIQYAKDLLEQGLLVGIPTETVYGLASNGLNTNAVLSIFEAKKRPSFDPLILHSTQDKIFQWAQDIPQKAQQLAAAFWPGPLTLVLPKADSVPYEVTSGLDTVGLRVPNHALTLELLSQIDFPLAAPSANPFGYISPTTADHVIDQLGDAVGYVLDGGACEVGIESTIIGFENDTPVMYRLGGLTREEIEQVIGSISVQINQASNPKAPGMIAVHYAPKKPLLLVDDLDEIQDDEKTAYLLFGDTIEVAPQRQFFLSKKGDYYEAAARLYALMRQLDQADFNRIVVKRLPEKHLGHAINDRLYRASVK